MFDFLQTLANKEPTLLLALEFLQMNRFDAISLVLRYLAHLIDKGLAEASVNRRLTAIKSLVNYAQIKGCATSPWLKSLVSPKYGKSCYDPIAPDEFKKMLAVPS